MFGQTNPFGGAVPFGQTTQSNRPSFGQFTQGSGQTFGKVTQPNPPSFGQSTQGGSAVFGQTTQGSSQLFPQSSQTSNSAFGQVTQNNPLVFGQTLSHGSTATTGQSVLPAFGQSAQFSQAKSSSVPTFGQMSQRSAPATGHSSRVVMSGMLGDNFQSSPFGGSTTMQQTSTVFSTSSPQSSSTIFGNVNPMSGFKGSSFEGSSKGEVFGRRKIKPDSKALFTGGVPSTFTTSSSDVGLEQGQHTSSLATNPFQKGKGFGDLVSSVFGGRAQSGEASQSSTASMLLASPETQSSAGSTRLSVDKDATSAAGQDKKVLFGMESGTRQATSTSLFTKDSNIESPATQGLGLFGKSVTKLHTESVLDRLGPTPGKSQRDTADLPDQQSRRGGSRGAADTGREEVKRSRGLFGRAIAGVAVEKKTDPTKSTKPNAQKVFAAPTKGKAKDTDEDEKARQTTKSKGKSTNKRITSPRSLGRVTSRLSSVEEPSAIMCRGVPRSCNNPMTLRKHFGQFGQVLRVFPNQRKDSAVIHFKDHAMADRAKRNGRVIKQGFKQLTIFWSTYSPKEKEDEDSDNGRSSPEEASASRRHTSRQSWSREHASKQSKSSSPRPGKLDDNAVNEELSALKGTGDVRGEEVVLLARPTEQSSTTSTSMSRFKSNKSGSATSYERPVSPVPYRDTRSNSPVPRSRDVPTSPAKNAKTASFSTDMMVSLRTAVGHTAAERRVILETRDKLIREEQGRRRTGNLAKADFIIGTCPDMCPERERYVREDQRRLSVYEIIPGTDVGRENPRVDHRLAVKEYSRSSADQEMPLPHELRPPAVLRRTMTYLLNNVMDCGGEGQWEDWYEYLWSRTRAIRKDITQQSLCDPTAVELVEKCSRFHIFCSQRLCEQSHMVFDAKLNNENLTKCLQSLKEMYHDLATRQVFCSSEPEFRAYMILMNLNEGSTLRDIQQLRPAVRASKPVEFALAAYKALNSNNYVRFFKLVARASYLDACILHRYFGQVRLAALKVMVRVYSIAGKPASYFPLVDLVHLLGFEDEAEAADFSEHYGLMAGQGQLLVDRLSFGLPDTAFAARRAKRLVEIKQTGTVGEVVNGCPLPPNVIAEPTSSFDASGQFRVETVDTVVAGNIDMPDEVSPPQVRTPMPPTTAESPKKSSTETHVPPENIPERMDLPVPNEVVKEVTKELFIEVIKDMCTSMGHSFVQARNLYMAQVEPLCHDVLDAVVSPFASQVCEEVVDEARRSQAELVARERAEKAAQRRRVAEAVTNDVLDSTVNSLINDIAVEEQRAVQQQLHSRSLARCTQDLTQQLCDQEIDTFIHQLATSYHEEEVCQRMQELEERAQAVQVLRCARFMRQWKNEYARRQRLKRNMLDFPAAPTMEHTAAALQHLLPESRGVCLDKNAVHLGDKAYLTLFSPDQIADKTARLNQRLLTVSVRQRLRHLRAWAPLELTQALGPFLPQSESHPSKPTDVYWKCLVALPGDKCHDGREEIADLVFLDWIKSKLTSGNLTGPEEYCGTSLLSQHSSQCGPQHRVHVTVRCLKGPPIAEDVEMMREKDVLRGCGLVLFVLPALLGHHTAQYWSVSRSHLTGVLDLFAGSQGLSLVVVSGGGGACHQAAAALDLHYLMETGIIAHFTLMDIEHDVEQVEASEQLMEALQEATRAYPIIPELVSTNLLDFIEDGLTREFYPRLQREIQQRYQKQQMPKEPSHIVTLYNCVLNHLANVVGDPALTPLVWPVSEFRPLHPDLPKCHWNSTEHLAQLSCAIRGLSLPEFCMSTPVSEEWAQAVEDLSDYIKSVLNTHQHSGAVLISRVQWLISHTEERFRAVCADVSGEEDCEPPYINMPWIHVIRECVDHCLMSLSSGQFECLSEVNAATPVYYLANHGKIFQEPSAWTDTRLSRQATPNLIRCVERSVKRKRQKQYELRSPPKQLKSSAVSGTKISQTAGSSGADGCKRLSELQQWVSPADRRKMAVPRARLDLAPSEPEELETNFLLHSLSESLATEKQHNSAALAYYDEALEEGEAWLQNYLSQHGLTEQMYQTHGEIVSL